MPESVLLLGIKGNPQRPQGHFVPGTCMFLTHFSASNQSIQTVCSRSQVVQLNCLQHIGENHGLEGFTTPKGRVGVGGGTHNADKHSKEPVCLVHSPEILHCQAGCRGSSEACQCPDAQVDDAEDTKSIASTCKP